MTATKTPSRRRCCHSSMRNFDVKIVLVSSDNSVVRLNRKCWRYDGSGCTKSPPFIVSHEIATRKAPPTVKTAQLRGAVGRSTAATSAGARRNEEGKKTHTTVPSSIIECRAVRRLCARSVNITK